MCACVCSCLHYVGKHTSGGRSSRGSSNARGPRIRGRGEAVRISGRGSGHSAGISSGLDTVTGCWGRRESSSFSFNYVHTAGPTSSSLGPSSSALDFFSHFYTDEVWELLKVETNRYADSTLIASPVSFTLVHGHLFL